MVRVGAFLSNALIKTGKGFYVIGLFMFLCALIGGLGGALLLPVFGQTVALLGVCVGGIIGLLAFVICVADDGFDETVDEVLGR